MRLKVIINDPNKKSLFKIINETLTYTLLKKELPRYYFGKMLYRKHVKNFKDYLSMKETDSIALSKKFNNNVYSSILRNKIAFSIYCEKNNINSPYLISYNLKSSFYYKKTILKINSPNDLKQYFENIFNDEKIVKLFLKPCNDMGGSGCIMLKKESINEQVEKHYKKIICQNYLHQELIIQHPSISQINPNCINSIRFDTYIDKFDKTHILSAFIRFGVGDDFVDNASSGGFCVGINLNDGTIKAKGQHLMKYGGKQIKIHPDTKFAFGGVKIPFFNEACELVIKAAIYVPDRLIGWDIAITPEGPTLVEGNDNNSIFMSDIAYGGYLKHPLFKEILEEAKN